MPAAPTWETERNEGIRSFTAGDKAGAIASFGRALALKPNDPDLLLKRAVLRQETGEYAGAAADYEAFLRLRPDVAEAYSMLAASYLGQRRYDMLKATLTRAKSAHPYFAYADNVFLEDALEDAVSRGVRAAESYVGRLSGDFPDAAKPGLVVFAAADGVYFNRYGGRLAETLAAHNPGLHLHFHLYNPAPQHLSAARSAGGARVTTTVTAEQHAPAHRNYFTNARFVVCREVHRRSRRPVFAVDVDSFVLGSLDGLDAVAGDVALRRRPRNHFEQQIYAAGLLARPTPGGDLFFDMFAGYMAHCLFNVGPRYFLDQVALNLIAAHVSDRRAPVAIGDLPARFCDHEGAADAVVRQVKGGKA